MRWIVPVFLAALLAGCSSPAPTDDVVVPDLLEGDLTATWWTGGGFGRAEPSPLWQAAFLPAGTPVGETDFEIDLALPLLPEGLAYWGHLEGDAVRDDVIFGPAVAGEWQYLLDATVPGSWNGHTLQIFIGGEKPTEPGFVVQSGVVDVFFELGAELVWREATGNLYTDTDGTLHVNLNGVPESQGWTYAVWAQQNGTHLIGALQGAGHLMRGSTEPEAVFVTLEAGTPVTPGPYELLRWDA